MIKDILLGIEDILFGKILKEADKGDYATAEEIQAAFE